MYYKFKVNTQYSDIGAITVLILRSVVSAFALNGTQQTPRI